MLTHGDLGEMWNSGDVYRKGDRSAGRRSSGMPRNSHIDEWAAHVVDRAFVERVGWSAFVERVVSYAAVPGCTAGSSARPSRQVKNA